MSTLIIIVAINIVTVIVQLLAMKEQLSQMLTVNVNADCTYI